jgi:hypothetical protein
MRGLVTNRAGAGLYFIKAATLSKWRLRRRRGSECCRHKAEIQASFEGTGVPASRSSERGPRRPQSRARLAVALALRKTGSGISSVAFTPHAPRFTGAGQCASREAAGGQRVARSLGLISSLAGQPPARAAAEQRCPPHSDTVPRRKYTGNGNLSRLGPISAIISMRDCLPGVALHVLSTPAE